MLVQHVIQILYVDQIHHLDFDMKEYDKQHFSVSSKQIYTVNESFPRIRRVDVPTEITNAVYQIDIPSIKSWEK